MKIKRIGAAVAAVAALSLVLSGCAGAGAKKTTLDPKNPTTVTVWNYYSGDQLESFNRLVSEFNDTKGKELGIIVEPSAQGSISDLEKAVIASAEKKVGAAELPNMFQAYTDTAYEMNKRDIVQDLSSYLTDQEKAEYVEGYIEEGDLAGNGEIKIFPTAKSAEVMVVNKTDWDKFAAATGADISALNTIEGMTETAKKYYEWSGGKSFFGRDAFANYMIVGSKQLGHDIITDGENGKVIVDFDEQTARKLWDNYYVPYISGYYSATGRFRSDDMKTGNVVAYVGSSSSATFTPKKVTLADGSSYEIQTDVYAAPEFKDGDKVAVQQGAGMVVTKGTEQQVEASVEFLKWFTDTKQNSEFAQATSYSPVKKEANDAAAKLAESGTDIVQKTLGVAAKTVQDNKMYTTRPIENGTAIRKVLDYAMPDKAKADREAVDALIAGGQDHDSAVASVATEENFKAWYQETKAKLEAN